MLDELVALIKAEVVDWELQDQTGTRYDQECATSTRWSMYLVWADWLSMDLQQALVLYLVLVDV